MLPPRHVHDRLPHRAYTLIPIATTGGRFADFEPYVASVDEDGAVAFQATLHDGGSGVYVGRGGAVDAVAETGTDLAEITSHPDIAGGAVCFYARLEAGGSVVALARDGVTSLLADDPGPLGPTLNSAGVAAYRTSSAVRTGTVDAVTTIAEIGPVFRSFDGLPVVDDRGAVTFRTERADGTQAICVGDGETTRQVASTGETYAELGRFPHTSRDGTTTAFVATLGDGRSGVVVVEGGSTEVVVDSGAGFESFRGALLDGAGRVVFYATPRAGTLGVYDGPEPHDLVLGIGSQLAGSTVADFALNPVSVNDAGQLTIRVTLVDGRGMIARADPSRTLSG
jgi:hypothetical protein